MDILKRFWFVILVAAIFLSVIGVFVNDKYQAVFKGKRVDGKSVVFEINGQDVTADDLYSKVYKISGTSLVAEKMINDFLTKNVELTSDELSDAQDTAASYMSYYTNNSISEETVNNYYAKLGYKDLEDYAIAQAKEFKLAKAYVKERLDTYYPKFEENEKPRLVSHILIKMDDKDNPTDEEITRRDAVDTALAGGMTFAEAAEQYSEDETSRVENGSIGFQTASSSLDSGFLAEMLVLNSGETSGWTKSTYGQHLIHIDSTALADFEENDDFWTALINYWSDNDVNLTNIAVWDAIQAKSPTFASTELEQAIKDYLGITEDN